VYSDEFRAGSFVAIDWVEVGDMSALKTRDQFTKAVDKTYPRSRKMQVATSAAQALRFIREMKPGDRVLTHDPSKREYLVGPIEGEYTYRPSNNNTHPQVRSVKWDESVQRNSLSVAARTSLGAIATLFRLPPEAEVG
jgi:restriction system protein